MKYTVQYRNMHDALHYLIIGDSLTIAKEILSLLDTGELETLQDYMIICNLQTISIDYRNPPCVYDGEKIKIINSNNIPDVYGV